MQVDTVIAQRLRVVRLTGGGGMGSVYEAIAGGARGETLGSLRLLRFALVCQLELARVLAHDGELAEARRLFSQVEQELVDQRQSGFMHTFSAHTWLLSGQPENALESAARDLALTSPSHFPEVPEWKTSFLEKVAENRRTLELARAWLDE